MQNNEIPCPVDLEFEISGEKLSELEWKEVNFLQESDLEIAHSIHKVLLKNAWEIISLEELKCQIIKNLHFIDLIKVKLDFSEIGGRIEQVSYFNKLSPYNTIENLPNILSNNLFGWVYYNEKDNLKTFRFILDISNGEIKYLK